ncbi:endo-alpha-N-acetylgalactosaminidase family protein, partial [Lachnoclostridium sp. An181]|uniref:endo-alpha-N-acetylgalactosaminidase family protein n=1 Tax=Lachnoclostridium sp. An181 TaxID=1965575 RepID=UPI00117AB0A6
SDVYLKDIHYTGQAEVATYQVTGKVVDESGAPVEGAEVKAGDQTTTTAADGTYMMALADGTYDITVKKGGYVIGNGQVVVNGADAAVADIVLKEEDEIATKVISSEQMDVYVAENFPSVVRYEMKGDLAGKTFYGQTEEINTVKINGTDVALDAADVDVEFEDDKAVYTMTVKDEDKHIDAVITAELVVEKNTLAFNITDIKNNLQDEVEVNKYGDKVEKYPLQTIAIPNHSLISVRSSQNNANLKGAVMSSNTHKSGDELIQVNADMNNYTDRDYMYAFVSNDEMSAGMWSNSEHEGRVVAAPVYGGSQNTRILATSKDNGDYKTMGLASAEWYYHRNVTDSKGVKYTVKETEMPQSKVVIAGDMNEDAQVDWQDGAIAFRDIMNNPYKCEEVPELVAWRIAMNFGGQAQNPFLTTLDNVKRVAMHTDGLGQSVLLKGYASEGHDSGHPDYDNIGERLGGAEDMNTMMEKGKEYGARFGIHVNASEMYPEAKAFSENLVRRNSIGSLSYGWNWLDQGVGIDGIYDLASGERQARFDSLKEKVGDNMDFVYVDVWGNLTSGSREDSWETRKLTDMITDNGWRMTTEWGSGNEYDSTFQHWATDLTYGGYTSKGENSEVMRFLRNHQKDSWVGDYPSYGGVANAPLLGGYNMKDFEGWQGRNDYDAYITNLYTHDLMTKFLQHYKVTKWVDGEPVQMTDNSETYSWTPEKEITLKDDDGNTVVATRESTDPSSAAYRNRTVTLNGKVISQGAVSRGDNGTGGTESYLIPWNWDPQTGEKVADDKEKMYHWNTKGGTTTWELQDDWKSLKSVKVYKLTDLGKTEEKTVEVVDGHITLEAEAQTPYVVCKGEEGNLEITWSEGMHLVDVGFNSGEEGFEKYWNKTGDGTATIAKSQYSNPMMKLDGEVAMSQKITDLEPGEKYALYVGVDNRSDAKATIEVKAGDKVLDSNYTTRSIAKNYVKAYTHSNSSATVNNSSYFQNMYVFFTAPEDGSDVTLTISKEAGEGSAYFDDIRVVETKMDVVQKDENGNVVGMEQDFENNVQGIYPFVIGGLEGVEDNRTHLSELHAPFTQAGWDVKKVDDVLDGKWSVKTNGLSGYSNLVYQTIPQNFRFEPGRTYKVSFDYQAGSDDTYGVTVGDGEFSGGTSLETLKKAMGADQDGHYETTITGAASGQTWFGIYSTSTAADTQGTSGNAANFGGYKDFILDNLKIELVEEDVNEDALGALIEKAESEYTESDYTLNEWNAFKEALLNAKVALNKDKPSQKEMEEAYYALKAAMGALDNSTGTATEDRFDISTDLYEATAGSAQGQSGNEGPVDFAVDGNTSTHWHTSWSANAVQAGDAWFNIHFAEAQTVDGIRYLPRTGAANANGKLKVADIQISKDNGKTYETVVENAEFDTATQWQKVKFAETDGVTDVKIIAKETAGQSAAETNKYASAAEFRVTKPLDPTVEEVDKTELKSTIDKAAALAKDDYTEASWKVFEEKLTEAQAVFANGDATQYDVALALANLE